MKRLWLITAFLLGLIGPALAQLSSTQTTPGDRGPIVFSGPSATFNAGHINSAGNAPTVTSCGGNPTITGSDSGGTVTVGGTPTTSCIITFAAAYGAAPACSIDWASGPLAAMSYTISTTAITITQTSTASNVIQYVCIGKQ